MAIRHDYTKFATYINCLIRARSVSLWIGFSKSILCLSKCLNLRIIMLPILSRLQAKGGSGAEGMIHSGSGQGKRWGPTL